MDSDEALRLLRTGEEGVAEWNRRREAGEGIPDLIEANLAMANLAMASLLKANLAMANLHGANLRGAVLVDADLRGALGLAQGQLEWARGDGETVNGPESLRG